MGDCDLVLAGKDHTYVLITQKAFLKIASFITVYLLGVNSQMHMSVSTLNLILTQKVCYVYCYTYHHV